MNEERVAQVLEGINTEFLDYAQEQPVVTSKNLFDCLVLLERLASAEAELRPFERPVWMTADPSSVEEWETDRWFEKNAYELQKELGPIFSLRDHHVPAVYTYKGVDYSLQAGRDDAYLFLASRLLRMLVLRLAGDIGEVLNATLERPERETALALELFSKYFTLDASVRGWLKGLGWAGTLAAYHHPEYEKYRNNVSLNVPRGGTAETLGIPHRDIALPVEVRGVPEPWGWGGFWNCVGDRRVNDYLPLTVYTGEPDEDFAFLDATFDAVELLVWYRQQLRPVDVEYLAKYSVSIHDLMRWTYVVYQGEDFPYSALDHLLTTYPAVNPKELLKVPGPIPSHVHQSVLHEYIRQHGRDPVFVEAGELAGCEFEFLNQWLFQTLTRNMVVAMRYLITNAHFNVWRRVEYVERAGELAKTPDLEHLAKALIQVLSNW